MNVYNYTNLLVILVFKWITTNNLDIVNCSIPFDFYIERFISGWSPVTVTFKGSFAPLLFIRYTYGQGILYLNMVEKPEAINLPLPILLLTISSQFEWNDLNAKYLVPRMQNKFNFWSTVHLAILWIEMMFKNWSKYEFDSYSYFHIIYYREIRH